MTLSDLAKYSVTQIARGLSATAELLVWQADDVCTQCIILMQCMHMYHVRTPCTSIRGS